MATPPERTLRCAGGLISIWGYKSPEYLKWRELAAEGKILVIETDASKLHGWSYNMCTEGRVVADTWPVDFATSEGQQNSSDINYKELWVATQCLRRESRALRGWRVLFRMDNVAAVHYVNVRYGRIPSLESLAERLETAERAAHCWALAAHIAGVANAVADAGSRSSNFVDEWSRDQFRDAALRPNLFRDVQSRCGVVFSLDLFSDRAGHNALAPQWRCPENTAFEAVLSNHVTWAHPPRALMRSC